MQQLGHERPLRELHEEETSPFRFPDSAFAFVYCTSNLYCELLPFLTWTMVHATFRGCAPFLTHRVTSGLVGEFFLGCHLGSEWRFLALAPEAAQGGGNWSSLSESFLHLDVT